jgi:hypothetical protein
MPELDAHLAEVLKVVTRSQRTIQEIALLYEKAHPPVIKVEVPWMYRTMLPNSAPKEKPPRSVGDALRELVSQGLVKRSVTRYLDGPLEEDTPVFSLPEPKK